MKLLAELKMHLTP